jgi:1-acyl-sn-glycerol-3-phosphate acyltransferase
MADHDGEWDARPDPLLLKAVRPLVRALARFHPSRVEGIRHVPRSGPAILVGNHGLLGYESPFFFERVLEEAGRLPMGLADKWFFRVPGLREMLVRLGGAYGSAANGLRLLRRGELVVCYPGGAREVLKHSADRYRCLWERSVGFVRLSILTGAPIIPFAAAGVDDTFHIVKHWKGSGEFLMGDRKYDLPLVWGENGPLPKPVPFWFRFGEPIEPPSGASAKDIPTVLDLHRRVWARTQRMVDELVYEWEDAQRTERKERKELKERKAA